MRRVLLAVVATAASLALAEVAVRSIVDDRLAAQFDGRRAVLDEPRVMTPDPELGWRNVPGAHRFRYRDGGRALEVTVTVEEDGRRRTRAPDGPPRDPDAAEVAFVGGSFTFGWAVGDDEHAAARLAAALPAREVVDLGVGGYGTYQSLLALERRYRDRPAPAAVVYGFASFHAERNVAAPSWRYMLYRFGARGYARVPFVSVADGHLVRHEPERVFPYLGMFRWSQLATQLMLYREMRAYAARATDPVDATVKLVLAMRDWAAARGAKLVIAYLDEPQRDVYGAAFRAAGIAVVPAPTWTPLPYDLHPDAAYHAELARRLEPVVRDALGE